MSFSDRIAKRCGKAYGSSGENLGSEFRIEGRNHALQTVMDLTLTTEFRTEDIERTSFPRTSNTSE